jgi:DNA segregation ATPase FtsK/SpoIIIE-like protein
VLPWAIDEHQEVAAWNLKDHPHALVSGATNSGKTVTLRAMIQAAIVRGFIVFIVDPKRIEMAGLRGWPGVRYVATTIEEMIALITILADEMDARYAAIEAGEVDEDHLPAVLLVIDEAREFIDRANAYWKANKTGTGAEHPVVEKWRSMARLGRSGRIHLLVGIQRPDAKVFGGEARDNYGYRVACGPISDQGAKMMFGRTDVGRDIPVDAKGRATVGLGESRVMEVQGYNSPDPRKKLEPAERQLVEALRVLATQHASDALQEITPEYVRGVAEYITGESGRKPRRGVPAATPQQAPRRQIAGWPTAPVDDLDEGDVVILEIDSERTEVTMTAPPVESPDDDTMVEIEYRRTDGRTGVVSIEIDSMVERRPA